MLVLTRREGQKIVVFDRRSGEELMAIHVGEIRRDRVRLSFRADDDLTILRLELLGRRDHPTPALD